MCMCGSIEPHIDDRNPRQVCVVVRVWLRVCVYARKYRHTYTGSEHAAGVCACACGFVRVFVYTRKYPHKFTYNDVSFIQLLDVQIHNCV